MRNTSGVLLAGCVAALAACGGGGGDERGTPAEPTITAKSLDTAIAESQGAPSLVLDNGLGETLEFFGVDDAGTDVLTQALFTSDSQRVRSIFEDGRLVRLIDENSGAQILIEEGDNRVDFVVYDAAGVFAGGVAVLEENGIVSYAPIQGVPRLDGQLTGQLNGSLKSGSFAVIPTPDAGLGPATALPAALSDRLLRLDQLGASPLQAAGFFSGVEGRLLKTGVLLFGAGVATAALAPAAGTVALGMAAAGLGTMFLSQYLPRVEQRAEDEFTEGQSVFDFIENKFSLGGSFQDASSDLVGALTTSPSLPSLKFPKVLQDSLDLVRDEVNDLLPEEDYPEVVGPPGFVNVNIRGEAVDQDSLTYTLEGQVDEDGGVTLATPPGSPDTIDLDGTLGAGDSFSGTFTSNQLGAGTASGAAQEFGDCAAAQGSGGQGTFSFAHNVGAAAGTVAFSYDAFSIPDAFDVRNNGQTLFSTGGLVSGGTTETLSLQGSSVVFVLVSAPQSGTAWVYEVGCASNAPAQ